MPKRPTAPVLIKKEASDLLSPPTTSIPVTPIKTKSQAGPRSKSTPEFKSKYTTVGTPTPTPIPESETSNRPDLNPTDPSLKLKKERSEDDLDLSSPWPGKKRKISGTGGDPGDMKSPGKKGRGAAWGDGKKSKLARFIVEHGIKSMGVQDYEMIAMEIGMNPSQVKDQTKPNRSNARSALLNLCDTL